MSLVSVSIIMYLVLSKDLFRTLLDEVPKDIEKWSLIFIGMPLHVEYTLCPTKNSPQVQCVCIVKLVYRSMVNIFHCETCEENPSLHPQQESCCYTKNERVQITHHTSEAKKKKNEKSVQNFMALSRSSSNR
jgi:hypothetical protein